MTDGRDGKLFERERETKAKDTLTWERFRDTDTRRDSRVRATRQHAHADREEKNMKQTFVCFDEYRRSAYEESKYNQLSTTRPLSWLVKNWPVHVSTRPLIARAPLFSRSSLSREQSCHS